MQPASPWAVSLSTAANLLRGKHKVDFTPNVDCGDFVIIVNADKAVLTGTQAGGEALSPSHRLDRRPEGNVKYATLMAERPEFAMELAVKGMLPKNTIGRTAMTRLKLLQGCRSTSMPPRSPKPGRRTNQEVKD